MRAILTAFGLLLFLDPPAFAATQDVADPSATASSFLLIGGAVSGNADLTGCDKALSDLHMQLDKSHVANRMLSRPSSGAVRQALLQFGGAHDNVRRAIIACGMGAASGSNAFLLGSDATPEDDLGLSAVSIRAFSRVSGGNGAVVLDLHPGSAGTTTSLDQATTAWAHDPTLTGSKFVMVEPSSGSASLVERLVQSNATSVETVVQTLDGASPTIGTLPNPAEQAPPPPVSPGAGQGNSGPPAAGSGPTGSAQTSSGVTVIKPSDHSDDGSVGSSGSVAPSGAVEPGADNSPESGDAAQSPKKRKPVPRTGRPADPKIRRLQVALLARGAYHGRIDGIVSNELYDSIRRFQAQSGHQPTGHLTPDELKSLSGG